MVTSSMFHPWRERAHRWGRFAHASPLVRRGVIAACVVVLGALYVKSVLGTLDRNDGYDYYVAARAILDGVDPRDAMIAEVGYITYPPSTAILFLPLAALGHTGFAVVWNAINALLVVVIPALAIGTLHGRIRGHPWWWYVLPGLVAFRLLETNATLSQSNLLVGFWCALAIYLLRQDRPAWAGLAIALGAAIKVTPGLFGVYFLYRGRWTAAIAAAAGAVLVFAILPALAYGPRAVSGHYQTWRSYAGDLVTPEHKQYNYMHGQSVQSALLRLLTESNARKPEKGPFYVNVLALDPAAVRRAVPVISVGLLLTLLAVCRGPTSPRDAPGPYLEMAFVLVVMLLMSPYVRKAHYAMLYPAVCLSIVALLTGAVAGRTARRLAWSLAGFGVLLNGTAPAIITKVGSEFFNGVCVFLWVTIGFAIALAGAIRAGGRAPAAPGAPAAIPTTHA